MDGYKETKIGTIPENWDVVKAEKLFSSYSSKNHPNEELLSATQDRGVLPRSMLEGRVMSPQGSLIGYKLVEEGDFVISLRSFQGGIEYSKYRGIVSPAYTVLKCNKDVYKPFYKYLMKKEDFVSRLKALTTGIRQGLNIKYSDFKDLLLQVPPISEQKNIAEILSTVDESIEKTDAIIEETRQLKKGLMQKLFTEGIGHIRFKETKIGRIPEEWDINRLKNFGEFLRGKNINKSEITESGFPCVRYGDIYVQYEFANTVTHFSAFIGKETADNGQRIKYGDIIFSGTGETQEDIGKCVAYVRDDEAYAGGDLFLFRPNNGNSLNAEFLSYCLNSGEVGRLKSRLGQGLSIFHIYPSHLKTLEVPLPTIEEQNQIVKILSKVDTKIEKEKATKAELEQLKKGLMQVLLTGKVRVKVEA